jgi:hypothetical protein
MMTAVDSVRGREVFATLFSGCDGLVELRALPSRARIFVAPTDADAIGAFLRTNKNENLYFGVATRRDESNGTRENCLHLPSLFLDLDAKGRPTDDVRAALDRFPLRPSIVINSGGGFHCYWLLCEPLSVQDDPAALASVLRRLASALGGDLAAAEPARVLRVPGSRNHKPDYETPRPVTIEEFEPSRRYNLSDFDEYLPPDTRVDANALAPITLKDQVLSGKRNDILYRLARSLRQKQLPEAAILEAVTASNQKLCRPPLGDSEVRSIVRNAVIQPDRPGSGVRRPERNEDSPAAEPVWRRLSDVEREQVNWLWPTRLAIGTLTIWMGDGGLGKSRASNDVAARVSAGLGWPDGGPVERGAVIILSAEDSASYTIRPAVEVAGGDIGQVFVLDAVRDQEGNERTFQLASDLAALERLIEKTQAKLVIIDPLSAYFGTKLDSYRDTDVRSVLEPVVRLAERRGVAVLGIMHVGKAATVRRDTAPWAASRSSTRLEPFLPSASIQTTRVVDC